MRGDHVNAWFRASRTGCHRSMNDIDDQLAGGPVNAVAPENLVPGAVARQASASRRTSVAPIGVASFAVALVVAVGALADSDTPDTASLSAGALTVARFDRDAYLQPAPGLSRQQLIAF